MYPWLCTLTFIMLKTKSAAISCVYSSKLSIMSNLFNDEEFHVCNSRFFIQKTRRSENFNQIKPVPTVLGLNGHIHATRWLRTWTTSQKSKYHHFHLKLLPGWAIGAVWSVNKITPVVGSVKNRNIHASSFLRWIIVQRCWSAASTDTAAIVRSTVERRLRRRERACHRRLDAARRTPQHVVSSSFAVIKQQMAIIYGRHV